MTDQITVPRATWDALVEALEEYLNNDNVELHLNGIKSKAIEALTAANAVQQQAQGEASLIADLKSCLSDVLETGAFSENAQLRMKRLIANHPQATEPEGWKLVPVIPTEEQWGGLARDIMMWLDMDGRKTPSSLFKHLERCGTSIPQWLRDEPEMKNLGHVPSKGTRVTIIYRAMLAAAPESP